MADNKPALFWFRDGPQFNIADLAGTRWPLDAKHKPFVAMPAIEDSAYPPIDAICRDIIGNPDTYTRQEAKEMLDKMSAMVLARLDKKDPPARILTDLDDEGDLGLELENKTTSQ